MKARYAFFVALALAGCPSGGREAATTQAQPAASAKTSTTTKASPTAVPYPFEDIEIEAEYLTPDARKLLRKRMHRHTSDLTPLMWAAIYLDYESIQKLAQHVREDPDFTKPLGGEDAGELNALLPEDFFQLENDLLTRAEDLATAAAAKDSVQVAEAFGRFAAMCIHCHGAYQKGRTKP